MTCLQTPNRIRETFWDIPDTVELYPRSEGLPLKYPRSGMHVGLITRSSGEKEIVFIGGQANGSGRETWAPADAKDCHSRCNNWYTKTVEIYNIASKTLRMGKWLICGLLIYSSEIRNDKKMTHELCRTRHPQVYGLWNDHSVHGLLPRELGQRW